MIDKAENVARRVARPLRFFRRLFTPFIVVLTAISDRILRALGVDPDKIAEEGGTPEELKALIAESYTGGKLDSGEAGMLTGVFHLHEQEARQVMTPIPAVVTVDVSEDVETALRRCISSGHTRLLVTEDENQDRVKGTVHSNSLARKLMTEGPNASIEDLIKDALIVPETKPLDDLLADLQRHRSSMAVVIDEYGRVAGIVTVEDIIEEVVGEIDDETDPAGGEIRRLANGDWFVRGHVAITDLHDYGLDPAGRHRRLQLGRRLRLRGARAAAQARRHHQRRRLLDPRGVGAREPHRGGQDPRSAGDDGQRRGLVGKARKFSAAPAFRAPDAAIRGRRHPARSSRGTEARASTGGSGWVHPHARRRTAR